MTPQPLEMILGEIQGTLKGIQRELERDRGEAREGRQRLYERVESVQDELKVTSQIATQARDVANAVSKTVMDDVKPQTDKIKNLGIKGGGMLAGITFVVSLGAGPAWAAIGNFFTNLTK